MAFRAILARVGLVRPALRAVLEHAIPLVVTSGRVSLLFESEDGHSFLATQATEAEALKVLEDAARQQFGVQTSVSVESGARPSGHAGSTLAGMALESRRAAEALARQSVSMHPLVAAAVRIFNAELREVRLPEGEE